MLGCEALEALATGNLICGLGADGRTALLLIYHTDSANLFARNVPNQMTYVFSRHGEGHRTEDGQTCIIVSTAMLPPDLYDIALGLDRRFGSNRQYPDTRLTRAELQLLLTCDQFFETRLLPGTESLVARAQKCRAVGTFLTLEWDSFHAEDSPSSVFGYDDFVPALVDLLEGSASRDEVAHFLIEMASITERPAHVIEQAGVAATGLMQLRLGWR